MSTRRLCYALDLKTDPALIAEYEAWHQPEKIWPEIPDSIKAAGVRRMEIYRVADRLFMIMEVDEDFDPTHKQAMDTANPRVQEWEALMSQYQQPLPQALAGQKWVPMQRIFALDS